MSWIFSEPPRERRCLLNEGTTKASQFRWTERSSRDTRRLVCRAKEGVEGLNSLSLRQLIEKIHPRRIGQLERLNELVRSHHQILQRESFVCFQGLDDCRSNKRSKRGRRSVPFRERNASKRKEREIERTVVSGSELSGHHALDDPLDIVWMWVSGAGVDG